MYNFWLPQKLNYSQIFASMDSPVAWKQFFLIYGWECENALFDPKLVDQQMCKLQ